MLDILLGALIDCPRNKLHEREPEIELLFQKLESVGEEEATFYTTRRAEYEFKHGNIHEACRLIDSAASKTPKIFDISTHSVRKLLERGIKTVASDEIEKIRVRCTATQPERGAPICALCFEIRGFLPSCEW